MPADSFIQLPADGAGKKLRTRQDTVGGNTVETQVVTQAAAATYYVWSGAVAFVANKTFLSLMNLAGSAKVVKLKKAFLQNLQLAAVTGVGVLFDFKRITAHSGGTVVSLNPADTTLPAPSASLVEARTGSAVTAGATLWSYATNNDEVGLTMAAMGSQFQAQVNLIPESAELMEVTLQPGEGFAVVCPTSTTLGSYGVLFALTVE